MADGGTAGRITDGPVDGTDGPVDGTDGPVDGTDGPVDGTDGPVDGPAAAPARRRRWLPRTLLPRRWWARTLLAAVTLLALVIGPPLVILAVTTPHLHDGTDGVRPAPVAIVLGALVDDKGNLSPFLDERVRVAVDLYKAGKVRALLMSGDNSRKDYDEVGAMAARAQQLGVPAAAIVQDHAGFDTYSSCYRARSVWGISRAVMVTQPFHEIRAVWTCRRLGVDAQGAATGSDDSDQTTRGWIREIPALDKAVLDVVLDRTPRFPGPREHALDAVNAAG